MVKFYTEDPSLTLRILHLGSVFFEGPVVWVSLTALDGHLQVYPGHAPLMTALKPGFLKMMPLQKSKTEKLFLGESIAHITAKEVTVFSTQVRASAPSSGRKVTPYVFGDTYV